MRRRRDRTWRRKGDESVLKAAGTQKIRIYIDRRQSTVSQWLDLWPIFEVYMQKTGCEGGGQRRAPWWRQTAADDLLRDTLKDISEDTRERMRR